MLECSRLLGTLFTPTKISVDLFDLVARVAKVSHRMIYSMKKANVEELRLALSVVLEQHAMQRSFELRGVSGEPAMRVIMRANQL